MYLQFLKDARDNWFLYYPLIIILIVRNKQEIGKKTTTMQEIKVQLKCHPPPQKKNQALLSSVIKSLNL